MAGGSFAGAITPIQVVSSAAGIPASAIVGTLGNRGERLGPVMASADRFDIRFTGVGAHAAMPHLGVDPVVAGAAFVQAAQLVKDQRAQGLALGIGQVGGQGGIHHRLRIGLRLQHDGTHRVFDEGAMREAQRVWLGQVLANGHKCEADTNWRETTAHWPQAARCAC